KSAQIALIFQAAHPHTISTGGSNMRRVFIALLFLVSTVASAQNWVSLPGGGCIGGSTCPEKRLRIPLEDKPVVSVRFHAHDAIGQKADGAVRVKIDGNTINNFIDIAR